MNVRRTWSIVSPALMLAAVAACQGTRSTDSPNAQLPPVSVEVARVRVGPASEDAHAVGSVMADESVIIRAEVAGRIEEIRFAEGQAVEQGQVLFTLDADEQQAQLAQSQAALALSEFDHQRIQELRGKKVVSQQEYDRALAQLREARAKVALDRARLEKKTIRAPFSGLLGIRLISPGDFVQVGQELVNLEAVDPVKIEFRIPGQLVHRVRPGQALVAAVDAYPKTTFQGEIYAINPRLDASTRTVQLRARLPNRARLLHPGMFAQVTLVLEERSDALWVPEQALVPIGNDRFVYRLEDPHTASRGNVDPLEAQVGAPAPPQPMAKAVLTRVETGSRRVGEVEIRAGLGRDDTVVVAGHLKLRDGAAVTLKPIPETSPPPAVSKR
ncbi:MAG: efflux RND transporter periplasmic adaptor subunit [Gammaproteobacteria bacterium]